MNSNKVGYGRFVCGLFLMAFVLTLLYLFSAKDVDSVVTKSVQMEAIPAQTSQLAVISSETSEVETNNVLVLDLEDIKLKQ